MSLSIIELLKHIKDELEFLVNDSMHYDHNSFSSDKKATLAYTRSFEIIGKPVKIFPNLFGNRIHILTGRVLPAYGI